MNGMNDKELQELTEESEEISAEYKSDETELDAQDGTGSSDEDEDEEEKKPFSDAHEWACSLVYAVLLMLGLNLFVFRSITVDGESMCNTLQHQDKIIATDFFYTPKRGDIVVVQANELVNDATGLFGEAIIKRELLWRAIRYGSISSRARST